MTETALAMHNVADEHARYIPYNPKP